MEGKIAAFLLVLVAVATASSLIDSEHVPIYQRSGAPKKSKWSLSHRAESHLPVTFTLALKQRNVQLLEQLLLEDADPLSPNYGQHLTHERVLEIVAPEKMVQRKVIRWIKEAAAAYGPQNLFELINHQDSIQVKATVEFVEKLFKTNMHVFINKKNHVAIIKHMGTLSIPQELVTHIELVTGITELPPTNIPFLNFGVQKKESATKKQAQDNLCNVPYNLRNLYGVPQTLTVTNPNATQSIYAEVSAGTQEGFGIGSVADFEHANNLPKNPITCVLGTGSNWYYANDTDTEAQLDTQMMQGMAPGAKTCFYIMDYGNGWMYEFANYVFHVPNAPLVVSMSYGWFEVEQCMNFTDGVTFVGNCTWLHIPNSQVYVNRTNIEFVKLGLVGHTLLAASGDDGTAGGHQSEDNCATMGPIYPSSSPWVLSIGATSIEASNSTVEEFDIAQPPICTNTFYQCQCTTSTNEQPALGSNTAGFDTGGGFSIHLAQPSYQTKAVQAYLKSGVTLPNANLFNPNNRGFPDISACGDQICLLDPGTPCSFVGGTSASTPLIGSLVTLLNQDRLNAGKKPLGFINPLIYQMYYSNPTKYFYNGFNQGNNAGECDPSHGFNAYPGWNPLTGCGSPHFTAIRAYVAALP
jgi:subtilase family serine protease